MKKHYKAVLLVLASDNTEIYRQFKNIYDQYLNVNSDIKVFFVFGNKTCKNSDVSSELVFDIPETYYPGMVCKTLSAINWVQNNLTCDYIIRTNISTFWIFDRLLQRLESLPKYNYATGPFRACKHKNIKLPDYISGTSLVMSSDAAYKLLTDTDILDIDYPEDYALSNSLRNSGVVVEHNKYRSIGILENNKTVSNSDLVNLVSRDSGIDHYRIKSVKDLRHQDIYIAKFLLNHYYGKNLL
jgi:hypothetical protein